METTIVSHTINPVFNKKSRILILGTMPSPASRAAGFYYMHPQNRFWPVLSSIFNVRLRFSNKEAVGENTNAAIDERKNLVLKNGIALWDVLAQCEIQGAEDSSIKEPTANDIASILEKTKISRIFCTGLTSFKLYQKLCQPLTFIQAEYLPSTSPANQARWPTDKLTAEYSKLIFNR